MALRVATLSLALASVCDGIVVRREGSSHKKIVSTLPPSWFDNGADISASQPNFANVQQVHSNLGGLGPDGGLEAIVYENIGSYKGQVLDLVFQADSTYTPSNVDNNKINTEGHMGQINIQCGSSVDLSVHIVKSGCWANSSIEDNEVALPIMFFSVLDFDAAQYDSTGTKGVEQVTIRPVFEYKMGSAVDVAESGPNQYTFTATEYGTGSDNPTDVYSLTEAQERKSVMIAIANQSSFSITLAASACSKGRNMLFTGPAPMVQETPASCKGMNTPDFTSATVSVNNLDGSDPGAAMMQVDNIITYGGKQVDLQVTPIDGNYQSYDLDKNTLKGDFVQINVAPDSSVVFRFQLLSDGEPISVPDFFFAYYDIDGTDDTFETLSLLGSSGTYFLSNTSLVTATRGPSKTTFTASAYGNFGDNPEVDVSDNQKDHAVEFHFESAVQYWDIEFGTAGFHTGRNFEFTGSKFACE